MSSYSASDFADLVLDNVGSKFIPAADNVSDFMANADNNIQFFDNRLDKLLNGNHDYSIDWKDNETFLDGSVTISFGQTSTGSVYAISTASNSTLSLYAKNTTAVAYTPGIHKISEQTAVIYYSAEQYTSGGVQYHGGRWIRPCYVNPATGTASVGNSIQIAGACSTATASSTLKDTEIYFYRAALEDTGITYTKKEVKPSLTSVYYGKYYCDPTNASLSTASGTGTLGSIYTLTSGKTTLTDWGVADSADPIISFDGEDVTVARGTTHKSPFVKYSNRTRNSSDSITTGNDCVNFFIGNSGESNPLRILNTVSGGVQSSLNPWIEDDGYVILDIYPNKKRSNAYVITYKPGTYSKENWLNNAFDIWSFIYTTTANSGGDKHLYKTDKKLPAILDDIII